MAEGARPDRGAARAPERSRSGAAERFVSEPIRPVIATSEAARMAAGEPGLPREFVWRGRTVRVVGVLRSWRDTGPCRHGSGERYVRRHWYEVVTVEGETMKLYFVRQPRPGAKGPRWWLFSVKRGA
jgi:phosphoribosylglycinamide formyltransferase-1